MEYVGDVNYQINAVTRYERTMYKKMNAFAVSVRSGTLYGMEKFKLIFPVMKDIDKAISMLDEYTIASKGDVRGYVSQTPVKPIMVTPLPERVAKPMEEPNRDIARAQKQVPERQPAASHEAQRPVNAPAQPQPAPTVKAQPATETSPSKSGSGKNAEEELKKLEAIYQTGMISKEEYKSKKAECVSDIYGLNEFYDKLKVNLQYQEIGFLSKEEFVDFKKETIDSCSDFTNVSNDVYTRNLKKIVLLNLTDIVTDAEYDSIRDKIIKDVQYEADDPEDVVVSKVERWPILKEYEFISKEQCDSFINEVAEDTKIKAADSVSELEHKLKRLTTLSNTFIFTPKEFEQKKKDFIADMSEIDYASDAKFKRQIEHLMTLYRCGWLKEAEYQDKTKEILQTIDKESDAVRKLQMYGLLVDVKFITPDVYDKYKQNMIDKIFSNYSDINELKRRAQTLMELNKAGVINENEFAGFKKKLLSM